MNTKKENSQRVETLEEFAKSADYSLMERLTPDPHATPNGFANPQDTHCSFYKDDF